MQIDSEEIRRVSALLVCRAQLSFRLLRFQKQHGRIIVASGPFGKRERISEESI